MYINTFFERNKLEYVGKTPQSQKSLILNVWLVGWLAQCRGLNPRPCVFHVNPSTNLTYTALKNELWLN